MSSTKISRNLLSEVQLLILAISMAIVICVVGVAISLISYLMISDLRTRAIATSDELVSLLQYPLYNIDNESAIRIAKAFLSSGKISGITLDSTAVGNIFTDLSGQDSPRITRISRNISLPNTPLGSFTITFSDAEIWKSQTRTLIVGLAIIVSVLLTNIIASQYIALRVRRPFQTIFAAIEKISAGNYQTQIELTQYRDINTLVALFNDMAGKLHLKNQEQKQIEQNILAERQYLIDIIDFLPDATFIVNTNKEVVVWNRAAEAMTGTQRADILGQGNFAYAEPFTGSRQPILIDLLDHADTEVEQTYQYVKRSPTTITGESYLPRLNGGQGAHIWGVAALIFDRTGKRSGAIEMVRDISDHKAAEQERINLHEQLLQTQKMESVGRLAGGIAHDFNNMLTVILGHTQLAIIANGPAEPLASHLRKIEETSHRSANLVRQLLAFARKQTVAPQIVDINSNIDNMLTMLQRLIGEDIAIQWRPGRKIWPMWIDPSQLDQIILNLGVNARDAIAGVGTITIETANIRADHDYCRINPESIPGDYVLIAISDDGCGMGRETIERIFEPFFSTKAIGKGTGMGLATVYGVIKQNKGFINVYSEPDKGTSFKVYLPRYLGEGEDLLPETIPTEKHGTGETILVVEDETVILDIIREMLEKLGYSVLFADTPGRAIEILEERRDDIQLLISDVIMPEMNGKDLEIILRAKKPDLKCLFISGYTADVIAHHGVLDRHVCFLQKPFSLPELAEKVRQALGVAPGSSQIKP